MARVSVFRKKKSAKITPLMFQVSDGDDVKIVLSAGISIKPTHWSSVRGRDVISDKDEDAIAKNDFLRKQKARILEIYLNEKAKGRLVDAAFIREALKPKQELEATTFEDDVIKQLEVYRNAPSTRGAGFLRSVTPLRQHLSRFLLLKKYGTLTFNGLTLPMLEAYHAYLANETEEYVWEGRLFKKVPLKSGTIKHHYTHLKLCSKMVRGEVKVNPAIFDYVVTTSNEKKRTLTWEEIKALMAVEAKSKAEQLTKDIFLFCCFTGIRIGSVQGIICADISNGFVNWFSIKGGKEKPVQTSIHAYNAPIIKRYKEAAENTGRLFPMIALQTMNRNIKNLCERAGIDRPDEVSTHAGRRSYNSLLYALGIDTFIRNEELGHAHGNVNEGVYTRVDADQRKSIIVRTMNDIENILARRREDIVDTFDDI